MEHLGGSADLNVTADLEGIIEYTVDITADLEGHFVKFRSIDKRQGTVPQCLRVGDSAINQCRIYIEVPSRMLTTPPGKHSHSASPFNTRSINKVLTCA
jgi:hypothetical protein